MPDERPPWEDEEPQGTPDLVIGGEDLQEPEDEPPLTQAEAAEAGSEVVALAQAGILTTGKQLQEEIEEIPPLPPLASDPHGPHPPEGLRFDFAWERSVVPHDPADRERERIRDTSALVPLPLTPEAQAEWAKSQAIWLQHVGQDYSYLFRKGHAGALEYLYPDHSAPDFAALLLRHGFPQEYAVTAARRRQATLDGRPGALGHPAMQELQRREDRHFQLKDEFSRAYVEAQRKKERGSKK